MQEIRVQSLSGEKSPRVGNGNRLQYSCQEDSVDRGAWKATVQWGGKEYHTTEHAHYMCGCVEY